jgi:hypothetical protein
MIRKNARPPAPRWVAFVAAMFAAGSGLACSGVEPPPSTPESGVVQRRITLRYTESCGDAGSYCTTRATRIWFVRTIADWCEDGGAYCAAFDRDDPGAP